MSFRKRSDIIGAPPAVSRNPGMVPGRPVGAGAVPGRIIPSRPVAAGTGVARSGPVRTSSPSQSQTVEILQHPGVRPSLITSSPTVSTGSLDLDSILLHQGLPLGASLLVEEAGTTDFALIILRVFASQGVVHNRVEYGPQNRREFNSHVIVVGFQSLWANELPGFYKGSSKDQKKANIAANEKKISVSNLNDSRTPASGANDKEMKIAWRYGLNKKTNDSGENASNAPAESSSAEHYTHQFDITQRLTPTPASQEVSFVSITSHQYKPILSQIQSIITGQLKQNLNKVIRLVIPNLLNPSTYPPQFSQSTTIIPFVHCLRALLRKYPKNLVLISSISLDLFPKETTLTYNLETLYDSVIQLQPFNQEMSQLIEKAYKNEPAKVLHGLVHIRKIPHLSEKGLMMIHDGEYAFRNGKKKFQIEEWGIPVEDDSKDEAQTTKNIEF